MAVKTSHIGLTKVEENDYYDISVQNNNMDLLDEEMGKKANQEDVANSFKKTLGKINEVKEELTEKSLVEINPEKKQASIIEVPSDAKGMLSVGAEGVEPLTQIISKDKAKWDAHGGKVSSTPDLYTLTGDSSSAFLYTDIGKFNTDKVFIKVRFKNISSTLITSFAVSIVGNVSRLDPSSLSLNEPTSGQWYEMQGLFDVSEVGDEMKIRFASYNTNGTDGDTMIIDLNSTAVIPVSETIYKNYTEQQMLDLIHRTGYFEGIATPSQSYDLVSEGVNIFDKSNSFGNYYVDNAGNINLNDAYKAFRITVKPNTKYYLKNFGTYGELQTYIRLEDSQHNFIDVINLYTSNEGVIQTTNVFNVVVSVNSDAIDSGGRMLFLNEGNIAPIEYKQYNGSKTEFSVPRPLSRIGDVYDEIDANGDLIYRNDKAIVNTYTPIYTNLELTDTIRGYNNILDTFGVDLTNLHYTGTSLVQNQSLTINGHMIEPKNLTAVNDNDEEGFHACNDGRLYMRIKKTTLDTYEGATYKEKLGHMIEKGMTLNYQLAEPITLKDGEQGFKAPTHLTLYPNGRIIVASKDEFGNAINALPPVVSGKYSSNIGTRVADVEDKVTALLKTQQDIESDLVVKFNSKKEQTNIVDIPNYAKGILSVGAEGVEPFVNFVDNGTNYKNWVINGGGTTKSANGIHLVQVSPVSEHAVIQITLQPQKQYTLVYIVTSQGLSGDFAIYNEESCIEDSLMLPKTEGLQKVLFTTSSTITKNQLWFLVTTSNKIGESIDFKLYGVYEGDQTNNPLIDVPRSYGLNTPALSYDLVSEGENLLNLDSNKVLYTGYYLRNTAEALKIFLANDIFVGASRDGYFSTANVELISISSKGVKFETLSTSYGVGIKVKVLPNTTYSIKHSNTGIGFFDSRGYNISYTHGNVNLTFTTPDNCYYILYVVYGDVGVENISEELQLNRGKVFVDFKPYTSSKTEFSTPEEYPLVTYDNDIANVINEAGYNINVKKAIFDGDEPGWHSWGKETENNTIGCYCYWDGSNKSDTYDIKNVLFSDADFKLANGGGLHITNEEAMGGSIGYFSIRVSTSRLITPDLEGFKQWLSENPITIYGETKKLVTLKDGEQGYIAPKSLEVFEGGRIVAIPTHKQTVELTNSNTITLDKAITSISYIRDVQGADVIELQGSLSDDGLTITLDTTVSGLIEVKGEINALPIILTGKAPGNLSSMVSELGVAVNTLNKHFTKEQQERDLINLQMDYRLTVLENK